MSVFSATWNEYAIVATVMKFFERLESFDKFPLVNYAESKFKKPRQKFCILQLVLFGATRPNQMPLD